MLNLLQQSRINPKLSAYAQVHGAYDFNATSVAPPGICVVVHEKPAVRGSWSIRGIDGWYLGHTLHQYICFEVFANNTSHSRIADTVEFFLHHFTVPFPLSAEIAIEAETNLHMIYKIHPQAHHSCSLDIPPCQPFNNYQSY